MRVVDINEKVFTELLSGYINGEKVKAVDSSVDWDRIKELGNIHNVSGIIYVALNDSGYSVPGDIKGEFYRSFLATAVMSAKRDNEAGNIIKLLTDNGIWHLVSKGYIIKNYYPNPELRTMGDIDFLVKEDIEKAGNVLAQNGYSISGEYYNEIGFDKGGLHFELHDQLNERIGNGIDFGKYYKGKCEKAVLIDGRTYRLTDEDHFIYTVVHIAKHFSQSGCGIRMIMDVAVIIKHFGDTLDWKYIWSEFDKIDLKDFALNVVDICRIWFNTDVTGIVDESKLKLKQNTGLYNEICDYIISAGVFGKYNRNSDFNILKNQHIKNNKTSGKVKNFIYWFFPDDEFMRMKYDWYKNKPVWLLPAVWVYRWWDSLKINGVGAFSKIFKVASSGKKLDRHQSLMERAGIEIK